MLCADGTAYAVQIRDMAAYFVACAVTLELLWDGAFSAREAGLLVALYATYLFICVCTSRYATVHMQPAPLHSVAHWAYKSLPHLLPRRGHCQGCIMPQGRTMSSPSCERLA